jgi:hypothetical protein
MNEARQGSEVGRGVGVIPWLPVSATVSLNKKVNKKFEAKQSKTKQNQRRKPWTPVICFYGKGGRGIKKKMFSNSMEKKS